nr:immunoglobulin heavy chain junction region [Macaca mulatta]MOW19687.1 immunoglobulin heavy chain junction region [Macaca mulatta]MOW20087.1 immunoglobulin heavy chain junction region [Macaca mulatta]MOW20562.1 immunoglobulin heavy chain junction region [Macaca mulatta]MOW21123.1 immunoglobulin heavy chain junction region [Macaca mulatta]
CARLHSNFAYGGWYFDLW